MLVIHKKEIKDLIDLAFQKKESPAFQARGHKAVTFIINLGLFVYSLTFWHIHTGRHTISAFFFFFPEIHIFMRQHHDNPLTSHSVRRGSHFGLYSKRISQLPLCTEYANDSRFKHHF